ncbi:hypothetical protein CM19_01275 [Candidatus Acidianus copahuensis]|uniref:Uncharacterized protein n=1 Tax=Candidatus Acidianus copahuensis TaxID=1160895 RepID=A0A031LWA0_9CREN|nr:hypothetical protein [Candidatus Acidianus copahuensis]EZQ11433.1 hypothetical protein CM19_01275 [Candidatus Acidianus copahuensis]
MNRSEGNPRSLERGGGQLSSLGSIQQQEKVTANAYTRDAEYQYEEFTPSTLTSPDIAFVNASNEFLFVFLSKEIPIPVSIKALIENSGGVRVVPYTLNVSPTNANFSFDGFPAIKLSQRNIIGAITQYGNIICPLPEREVFVQVHPLHGNGIAIVEIDPSSFKVLSQPSFKVIPNENLADLIRQYGSVTLYNPEIFQVNNGQPITFSDVLYNGPILQNGDILQGNLTFVGTLDGTFDDASFNLTSGSYSGLIQGFHSNSAVYMKNVNLDPAQVNASLVGTLNDAYFSGSMSSPSQAINLLSSPTSLNITSNKNGKIDLTIVNATVTGSFSGKVIFQNSTIESIKDKPINLNLVNENATIIGNGSICISPITFNQFFRYYYSNYSVEGKLSNVNVSFNNINVIGKLSSYVVSLVVKPFYSSFLYIFANPQELYLNGAIKSVGDNSKIDFIAISGKGNISTNNGKLELSSNNILDPFLDQGFKYFSGKINGSFSGGISGGFFAPDTISASSPSDISNANISGFLITPLKVRLDLLIANPTNSSIVFNKAGITVKLYGTFLGSGGESYGTTLFGGVYVEKQINVSPESALNETLSVAIPITSIVLPSTLLNNSLHGLEKDLSSFSYNYVEVQIELFSSQGYSASTEVLIPIIPVQVYSQ